MIGMRQDLQRYRPDKMSSVPFKVNRPAQLLSNSWISSFRRGGIDHKLDFRDTVRWEASLPRMFTNLLFAGSDIDGVNLVGRSRSYAAIGLHIHRIPNALLDPMA